MIKVFSYDTKHAILTSNELIYCWVCGTKTSLAFGLVQKEMISVKSVAIIHALTKLRTRVNVMSKSATQEGINHSKADQCNSGFLLKSLRIAIFTPVMNPPADYLSSWANRLLTYASPPTCRRQCKYYDDDWNKIWLGDFVDSPCEEPLNGCWYKNLVHRWLRFNHNLSLIKKYELTMTIGSMIDNR